MTKTFNFSAIIYNKNAFYSETVAVNKHWKKYSILDGRHSMLV